ncbi:MAG: carboxypeptidase-like regulatory domain-containing protein, partial [Acidobacteriaceae bacterium]
METAPPAAFAQTAVTGSINGTVTDSTGAVVPNAAVTVKDNATGATLNLTTNSEGRFVAPFLKPDDFSVSAMAPGLQSVTTTVQVLTGQQSVADVVVTPSASSQTVQVSASNAQLIDTQTSNTTTTFTTQQFQNLPMPGGDITTIAYTVPGVLVNPGSGYGNFTSNGLPGLSNLVIINGADNNDPFLHLNNSGSSNMLIGQEEIAQASVVQNGYSVQYGRQAGAIETYTTKSGSNRVHGLLTFNYNSSGLNANDFFNNLYGQPKSKAVSRQYAAQIGGPIWRNKLFFFADTEGIRYILPTSAYLNFPSAEFQNTILNTIPATSVPLYTQMFKTFTGAPAYAGATPVDQNTVGLAAGNSPGGCGGYAGSPVFGGGGTVFGDPSAGDVACLNAAYGAAGNLNKEYTIVGRVDWIVSPKQAMFLRILRDTGQQPTTTSLMSPLLNTGSTQPQYAGQLTDTYTFSPNVTNQLVVAGLWYSAVFGPADIGATLAFS